MWFNSGTEDQFNWQVTDSICKPSFHYPSSRPELTVCQLGPWTQAVNTGNGNRALVCCRYMIRLQFQTLLCSLSCACFVDDCYVSSPSLFSYSVCSAATQECHVEAFCKSNQTSKHADGRCFFDLSVVCLWNDQLCVECDSTLCSLAPFNFRFIVPCQCTFV